ncbi:unnamed protein product, partial [marine sediment metagenome]
TAKGIGLTGTGGSVWFKGKSATRRRLCWQKG